MSGVCDVTLERGELEAEKIIRFGLAWPNGQIQFQWAVAFVRKYLSLMKTTEFSPLYRENPRRSARCQALR
jgi:hypothetical protein